MKPSEEGGAGGWVITGDAESWQLLAPTPASPTLTTACQTEIQSVRKTSRDRKHHVDKFPVTSYLRARRAFQGL